MSIIWGFCSRLVVIRQTALFVATSLAILELRIARFIGARNLFNPWIGKIMQSQFERQMLKLAAAPDSEWMSRAKLTAPESLLPPSITSRPARDHGGDPFPAEWLQIAPAFNLPRKWRTV